MYIMSYMYILSYMYVYYVIHYVYYCIHVCILCHTCMYITRHPRDRHSENSHEEFTKGKKKKEKKVPKYTAFSWLGRMYIHVNMCVYTIHIQNVYTCIHVRICYRYSRIHSHDAFDGLKRKRT